jgi:hypothetical protein
MWPVSTPPDFSKVEGGQCHPERQRGILCDVVVTAPVTRAFSGSRRNSRLLSPLTTNCLPFRFPAVVAPQYAVDVTEKNEYA